MDDNTAGFYVLIFVLLVGAACSSFMYLTGASSYDTVYVWYKKPPAQTQELRQVEKYRIEIAKASVPLNRAMSNGRLLQSANSFLKSYRKIRPLLVEYRLYIESNKFSEADFNSLLNESRGLLDKYDGHVERLKRSISVHKPMNSEEEKLVLEFWRNVEELEKII